MTNPPTDLEQRIERFEHMAKADPENEMAHFSLGNAYSQMGRHAEAAEAFEECTRINPEMSKAWQLCGQEMVQAGWEDKAVKVLERGYEVAASKGDLMPRDAIADLLRSIGKQPPELSQEVNEAAERIREDSKGVADMIWQDVTEPTDFWVALGSVSEAAAETIFHEMQHRVCLRR